MPLLPAGLPFTGLSGAVGDVIASRNPAGPYFRPRTLPWDPNTLRQQIVRAALAAISVYWRVALTTTDRDAWNAWAAEIALRGPTARRHVLTGREHFLRCNVIREQNTLSLRTKPPSHFHYPVFDIPVVTIRRVTPNVAVWFADQSWVHEKRAHLIVATAPIQDPAVTFYKGPYRIAGTIDGDPSSPPTSPQFLPSPWLLPHTPASIHAKIRLSAADGRLSTPVYTKP